MAVLRLQTRFGPRNGTEHSGAVHNWLRRCSNALVKYDLLYDGTNANLVLSVDTVGNSTNANGHELFRILGQGGTWGALTQLTSDSNAGRQPTDGF